MTCLAIQLYIKCLCRPLDKKETNLEKGHLMHLRLILC